MLKVGRITVSVIKKNRNVGKYNFANLELIKEILLDFETYPVVVFNLMSFINILINHTIAGHG